jgi:hypothetical protein
MFTIKHIHLDGSEEIHEAKSVRFSPSNIERLMTLAGDPNEPHPDTLWVDGSPLTGGTAFVMNEAGKTVSRYDLGASNVPLSDTDVARTPNYRGLQGGLNRANTLTGLGGGKQFPSVS